MEMSWSSERPFKLKCGGWQDVKETVAAVAGLGLWNRCTVQASRQTGAFENQRPAPAKLTVNNEPGSFFHRLNHSQSVSSPFLIFCVLPWFGFSHFVVRRHLCSATKGKSPFKIFLLIIVVPTVWGQADWRSPFYLVHSEAQRHRCVPLSMSLGLEVQSWGH